MSEKCLEHIAKDRRHLAAKLDSTRISLIYSDAWINYPAADSIRACARAIQCMPAKQQAQCLLITASPGMGKTTLFKKVAFDLDVARQKNPDMSNYISVDTPADPTLTGLEDCLSVALKLSPGIIKIRNMPGSLVAAFQSKNIRILLMDEVNNLLIGGRVDQRKNLALLRALSGPPLSLSIIGFGVEDADNALENDPQLARRFQRESLPSWTESEEFRSFLAGYEQVLPLRKPSRLYSKDTVKYLLKVSGGQMDIIIQRIQRGGVWAILDKKESIDLECLVKARSIPPNAADYRVETE